MENKIFIKNASSITKKVVSNYNKLSNKEFKAMYQCSKEVYLNRVKKYGDPFMNAPLAKFGKLLNRLGMRG